MSGIVFEKAQITGLHQKIGSGGIAGKIEVSAVFTAANARLMGAQWVVFDKEQIVKGGFKSIELDYAMQAVKANFTPGGNLSQFVLDLTSEAATNFKVMVMGDGKKKAKRLLVKFKLAHGGSQLPLVEYLERIGGAIGRMQLTPAAKQEQLPLESTAVAESAAKAAKAAAGSKPEKVEDPLEFQIEKKDFKATIRLLPKGEEFSWQVGAKVPGTGTNEKHDGPPFGSHAAALVSATDYLANWCRETGRKSENKADGKACKAILCWAVGLVETVKATFDALRSEHGVVEAQSADGWPIPNEHGVYEQEPFSLECALPNGAGCGVYCLQIGPDAWAQRISLQHAMGGQSGPLTDKSPEPSLKAAQLAGLKELIRALLAGLGTHQDHKTASRQLNKMILWTRTQIASIEHPSAVDVEPAPVDDDTFVDDTTENQQAFFGDALPAGGLA